MRDSHRGLVTFLGADERPRSVVLVHCCHCGLPLGSAEALLHQRARGEGEYGWCDRCQAMHHGGGRCLTCTPQEQACENVEAGRSWSDNGTASKIYLPVAFPGK